MKNVLNRWMAGILFGSFWVVAQAALSPLGSEFPLLGNLDGHQQNPHVALGPEGGFVVWQTTTEADSTERVMVQRLGGDMTGLGMGSRVSKSADQWNELDPHVALRLNGGAVVVWVGGPRASTDIYIRFLDRNGNYLGMPTLANSSLEGIQSAPNVITLSDGGVVVAWTSLDQDADGEGVYAQIFTAEGARLGGEFRVNQSEASNQSDAALAPLGNGHFVVAWVNEAVAGMTSSGAQNLRGNLMGRVFNAQGGALGDEYQLNDGNGVGFSPALTARSDGGFTLAWAQRDEENMRNLSDIYVRSFNSSGLPLTDNQRHNTWLQGQQMSPELVQLGGETMVVWASYGQDESGGGIQGRLLSGGREFQVNSQGRMHQRAPSVATDGVNKFLAIWVNTVSPAHSILSGQRYVNSDGELGGVVDITEGDVKVVQASEGRRRATPVAQGQQSQVLGAPTQLTLSISPPVTSEGTVVRGNTINPVASNALVSASSGATSTTVPLQPRLGAQRSVNSSLNSPSANAGRHTLLAAARQRSLATRSLTVRPGTTLAQSRSGQAAAATTRQSHARQLASLRSAAPRSSTASRRLQLPGYQRSSSWRTGVTTPSRTSQLSQFPSSSRRAFASASSRFDSVMRNSLSRTGTERSVQPKPVATSLKRSEGGTQIQWTGRSGARYQVQGSKDLRQWTNVGAARSGAGRRDAMQINPNSGGPRYYRVIQLD